MHTINNVSENNVNATPVASTPAPQAAPVAAREPVMVEGPAPVQMVSLQELLNAGISVKVDAPQKTKVDHAIEVGKVGLGVAAGIGLSAGCYALGKWVIGLFGDEAAE